MSTPYEFLLAYLRGMLYEALATDTIVSRTRITPEGVSVLVEAFPNGNIQCHTQSGGGACGGVESMAHLYFAETDDALSWRKRYVSGTPQDAPGYHSLGTHDMVHPPSRGRTIRPLPNE